VRVDIAGVSKCTARADENGTPHLRTGRWRSRRGVQAAVRGAVFVLEAVLRTFRITRVEAEYTCVDCATLPRLRRRCSGSLFDAQQVDDARLQLVVACALESDAVNVGRDGAMDSAIRDPLPSLS
jgi:hypothetical protein